MAFASSAPKGVLISSLVTSPTSISLLSPELDVELSELERSSGEQRGNQRKYWMLTLLFAVALFCCGDSWGQTSGGWTGEGEPGIPLHFLWGWEWWEIGTVGVVPCPEGAGTAVPCLWKTKLGSGKMNFNCRSNQFASIPMYCSDWLI